MSDIERKIDTLQMTVDQFIKKQSSFNNTCLEEFEKSEKSISTIKRGMYGDQENEILGLIQLQKLDGDKFKSHDKRIKSLENSRMKFGIIFGTLLTGFEVFKDRIMSIFH